MRQSIISTFITAIAMSACTASAAHAASYDAVAGMALSASNAEAAPADNTRYTCQRPKEADRLFVSDTIEKKIREVKRLIRENARLAWMFENCFPNTLDTTVHYDAGEGDGKEDTFVYTGDIHAMWLRDSAAQVWPYVQFAKADPKVKKMIRGVIRRQLKCINIDPYANAFNKEPQPNGGWMNDITDMKPELHERKYEIDSLCYPIRLAYHYWQTTGDASVFDAEWQKAVKNVLRVFHEQQRKTGLGTYHFQRETEDQLDTVCNHGWGNPVKPVGLIASVFRPSDDAATFLFLVPSNFMAVSSLRKAAEILEKVNNDAATAKECRQLADEVSEALRKYAVVDHPKYGKIYAYEVDGFGNHFLMDDANVPSLLAMPYLGDVPEDDPIYQNTRRFVWSEDNPYFFRGKAGEGVGGPHVGLGMAWPMSIMMRAFTSKDDDEIKECLKMLQRTDAGTGFIHESFDVNDASHFTRPWFAWQNTLFGELILKLVAEGKTQLLKEARVDNE
ncbi:glycoside hydrolase family 125 protein [Prevotella sp.]|uniref:glycoside hydrolase family 125 protein n=1 Tax=Prevotella sp. TaxID=59823 RepID=UPI0025CF4EF2|nr:glycoside hydrolase family 125 protein [Prevotella sp.]